MNVFSNRIKILISLLYEHRDEVVTSAYLAQATGVTARTIKHDVAEINALLADYGAAVVPRYGKGYQLRVDNEFLFQGLLSEFKNQDLAIGLNLPDSRFERVNYIIKKLLAVDYYISLDDLAQELFVSRSTLTADLKEVRTLLSEYRIHVVSKPNYGIIIEGNEIDRRLCISEYYFHSNLSAGFFASDNAMFVNAANSTELTTINTILKNVISKYDLTLSDASIQNMVIHIVISMRRWKFYNYVHLDAGRAQEIVRYPEYAAGDMLRKELENWLEIILPFEESLYFTLHFHSKNMGNPVAPVGPQRKRLDDTVARILAMLKQNYGLGRTDTSQFELYLRAHIPPMTERLRNGMIVRNFQCYKVIGSYPLAVQITFDVSAVICESYQVAMELNEFAYLVLYANLLVTNPNKDDRRVLLVCFQGRPEMAAILNEINEYLIQYRGEIDVCDYGNLERINPENYDLVITTIPIDPLPDTPVFQLTFDKPYHEQIRYAIENASCLSRFDVKTLFQKRYFLDQINAADKDDVIRKISRQFADPAAVAQALMQDNIAAETDKRVVYLHSQPVSPENFIFLVTLKKPIIWRRQTIQVVIWPHLHGFDFDELKCFYRTIDNLVATEVSVQKLLAVSDHDQLLNLLEH